MRAPPGGIAGGAHCVLERSSEMRDEGLLLRWTADHNAAAYERPRCADSGPRGAGGNPRPAPAWDATPEFRSRRLGCWIKASYFWRTLALAGNSTTIRPPRVRPVHRPR